MINNIDLSAVVVAGGGMQEAGYIHCTCIIPNTKTNCSAGALPCYQQLNNTICSGPKTTYTAGDGDQEK